jgi:hypothetical protein
MPIVYYAENLEISCSVVNELDRDNASSITILQDIFKDSNELKVLKTDLAYIHANFSFITVYNKVGKDHKFVVRNNKGNQQHLK